MKDLGPIVSQRSVDGLSREREKIHKYDDQFDTRHIDELSTFHNTKIVKMFIF